MAARTSKGQFIKAKNDIGSVEIRPNQKALDDILKVQVRPIVEATAQRVATAIGHADRDATAYVDQAITWKAGSRWRAGVVVVSRKSNPNDAIDAAMRTLRQ